MPQSASNDTILRHWAILRKIPFYPKSISASDLREKISDDYEVTVRTIQRDLNKLSEIFPLIAEEGGKANRWSVMKDRIITIPGMDVSTAIAFYMAQGQLEAMLPSAVLEDLKPYFEQAKQVINTTQNGLMKNWPDKVMVLNRGPRLTTPKIKTEVQQTIYIALLKGKKILAYYRKRGKKTAQQYTLSPQGIFIRNGLLYLACKIAEYDDFHLPLHRFEEAELLAERSDIPNNLNFHNFVKEKYDYSYPLSAKPITLKVLFEREVAEHLYETKLANNQIMKESKDNRIMLTAKIPDSLELRWWLQSFGDQVEVAAPRYLRNYFSKLAASTRKLYSTKASY